MAGCQASAEELAKIDRLIADLKARLAPSADEADEQAKAVAIAKVLSAFPAQDQSDLSAKLRMDAYFEALASMPGWSVAEAGSRIIAGIGGLDQRFAPTPPQIAEITRAVLQPMRSDLADLERIAYAARQPPYVPPAYVAAFSRAWWRLFIDLVTEGQSALRDKDSYASRRLRQVASLAMAHVGWKVEQEKLAGIEERAKVLVAVMVPSPEADAWQKYFANINVNMPVPSMAPIWMESSHPSEEEDFGKVVMGETV